MRQHRDPRLKSRTETFENYTFILVTVFNRLYYIMFLYIFIIL
ncbi:hypothetical protein Avbf_05954 [Armadillidium vulgare]|nr:hypothetical protein Avbf_05954 [Armadillidium vulgare]